MKQTLLVIAGAAIGGTLGFFAFFWIAGQGYYGLVIPGGFLGIGAALARNRSLPLAVACAVAAVLLGLYTEWRFAPFAKDESLGYFLLHIHKLKPLTLLMVALGGVVGFRIPYRGKGS
jgi:hypothetical protein